MSKLKSSRVISFVIIAIIYFICYAVGLVSYAILPFSMPLNLFLADTFATVTCFIFSLIFKNSSVYDPYWSVAPLFIVISFAVISKLTVFTVILIIVISIWAVRLTLNWAYTFKNLYHQDWRYTMLKEKTGKLYLLVNFLGIHYFPTLVVYLCILPAVFAIKYGYDFNFYTLPFIILSLLSVLLQGVSDYQMHKFRKSGSGGFIKVGLWKHSRHPNYLGEILMWWGVGLACSFANLFTYLFLIGAIVNNLMFIFISIPLADGRQSRKTGFIDYKKTTRALLPIKKFKNA